MIDQYNCYFWSLLR